MKSRMPSGTFLVPRRFMKNYRKQLARFGNRRSILCFGTGILVFVVCLLIFFSKLLWPVSLSLSDILYQPAPRAEDIVVLAVDDKSLQEIGRWPWDRKVFAALIGKLQNSRAIGMAISFFEPSGDDGLLAQAIDNSRVPVVLASEFSGTFLKPAFASKAKTGHVNLLSDKDGVIRSVPTEIGGEPSFASMIAQIGEPLAIPENLVFRFSQTPVIVSIADVLLDRVSIASGKTVLVGVTAPDFHDDHLTPIRKAVRTPGVIMHADAIATLQRQDYLNNQGIACILLSMGLLSLVAMASLWAMPLGYAISCLFLTIAGYLAWAREAFDSGTVVDLLHPVGSSILVAAGCTLALYFAEIHQRKWITNVFGKYVAKEVVEEIMAAMNSGQNIGLGGERRHITVLFSDIRGFTTLCEALTPEQVVEMLNEYFSLMTEEIINRKGVVDKYIGDAIMAFWNAPVENKYHAVQACRTALCMVRKLDAFNQLLQQRKQLTIDIGIGINSGDALVGNIGYKDRLSYTAMGDSVNLASRIEGLTKQYGTRILISEFTHMLVMDAFVCRKLDLAAVKGKARPIYIYEVMGETADAETLEFIGLYERALAMYLLGEFSDAGKAFEEIIKLRDDIASNIMIERCMEYIRDKPQDWIGAYVMQSK